MNLRSTLLLLCCLAGNAFFLPAQILRPLYQHPTDSISGVFYSKDAKKAAVTYAGASEFLLFDLVTGARAGILAGHERPVRFVVFDEFNRRIISVSTKTAIIWSSSDFRQISRVPLRLQPEASSQPETFDYDPLRELIFRSSGSDLYCYSLRQEGLGKFLESKKKKERNNGRALQLAQPPNREHLWVLDTTLDVLKEVGLDYFKVQQRIKVDGARTFAVDNQQVVVLLEKERDQLLLILDAQGVPVDTIALPAPVPLQGAQLHFTGRRIVSLVHQGGIVEVDLSQSKISSFPLLHSFDALHFEPEGGLLIQHGTTLKRLDPAGRLRLLHSLQRSPWLLHDDAREGAWVLSGSQLMDLSGQVQLELPKQAVLAAGLHDNTLALQMADGLMYLYDLYSRSLLKRFPAPKVPYNQLLPLPKRKMLLAAHKPDESMILLDWETGRRLARFSVEGTVSSYFLSGDRLFLGGSTGTLAVYSLTKGVLLSRHDIASGRISALAVAPGGNLLAAATPEGVDLYALPRPERMHRLIGHDNAVRQLSFAADGSQLVSVAGDGVAKVWDVFSGALLENIRPNVGNAVRVAMLNAKDVVVETDDGQILLRPANIRIKGEDRTEKPERTGPRSEPLEIVLDKTGRWLARYRRGGTEVDIWDAEAGIKRFTLQPKTITHLRHLTFFDQKPILLLAGASTLEYWDVLTGKQLKQVDYRSILLKMGEVFKEPGTDRLWTFEEEKEAFFSLDSGTGNLQQQMTATPPRGLPGPEALMASALSNDGRYLALRGKTGIYIYQTARDSFWTHIRVAPPALKNAPTVYLSPSAHFLVFSEGAQRKWVVYDLFQEKPILRLPAGALSFLDGYRLALAPEQTAVSGAIDIWDLLRQAPVATIQTGHRKIGALATEPLKGTLVSMGKDGDLLFWNYSDKEGGTGASELVQRFPLMPQRDIALSKMMFDGVFQGFPPLLRKKEEKPRARFVKHSVAPAGKKEARSVTKSTSLRAGAGAAHRVLLRLHPGYEVKVVEWTDNYYWAKVQYKGRTGWAKKALLE